MDAFAALFTHAAPSAHAFFAGNLCEAVQFEQEGHLHLLNRGALTLARAGADDLIVDEPSLLFFPRGCAHRLLPHREQGADLVCAVIDLGHEIGNPIGQGLPEFVQLPIAHAPEIGPACALLVTEGLGEAPGRESALDKLFDYLLILVVRVLVARGDAETGVLAGLADPRLSRALTAMHEQAGEAWTLEDLADAAGMSRARFAAHFRTVVGRTPLDYLTGWRMTLARQQIAAGKSVKAVASAVGYDSPAAFSRVFARVTGRPPRTFGPPPRARTGLVRST